ncbi:MAG: radical SAM family heme chaperone HemW [Nitrospirae bacterium]|nr:radical SAM family heme chaperone HemW [Nitrospirota bacterium]
MVNYLYIHVPFCIAKCHYCDFYSVPVENAGPDATGKYVRTLLKEMKLREGSAGNLKTVYLGGGTPTLLSGSQVADILSGAREIFALVPRAEISIEANPGTVSEAQLAAFRESGVNRISIGVQSLADHELCVLGRRHKVKDAFAAFRAARSAGFDNISLDLIYGIPGQSMDAWENTVSSALDLSPEHVSAYELTPEESTPLQVELAEGVYALPDELLVTEMYYAVIEKMKKYGYLHYEISNFAKPAYECAHNLNYWNRGEYLGIGAGAHSYFDGKRSGTLRDLARYVESIEGGTVPVDEEVNITEQDEFKEMIFLGLRKIEGIDLRLMPESGKLLTNKAVDDLIHHGLIEIKDQYLRLTAKGLVLSTEVMVRILNQP